MKILAIILISAFTTSGFTAVSTKATSSHPSSVKDTIMALKLPLVNRLHVLRAQNLKGVGNLKIIANNEKNSIHLRWRALTALGSYSTSSVVSFLVTNLKNKKWFIRNASLIALRHSSPTQSIKWSKLMLNDPALVVRTAAVQNLKKLNVRDSSPLLWKSLNSKLNYKGKESLWIRKHIVLALSKFAKKGEEAKFVKVLKDRDKKLHPIAVKALEKITNKKLGALKSTEEKSKMWLAWWSANRTI